MEFHKGKCKILLGRNHPMQHFRLEVKQLFRERPGGSGVQQAVHEPAVCPSDKKASDILECIRKSTAISLRGVILPLISAPHLESWIPFRGIHSMKLSDLALFFYWESDGRIGSSLATGCVLWQEKLGLHACSHRTSCLSPASKGICPHLNTSVAFGGTRFLIFIRRSLMNEPDEVLIRWWRLVMKLHLCKKTPAMIWSDLWNICSPT